MRKILLLATLFSALCLNTMAQDTDAEVMAQKPYFGYLSYDSVMHVMPEYANAITSYENLKTTYDNEMKRSEQDFNKQFKEYVDGQKSFPENIMLKRQKELQQLMDQTLQFKNEAEQLLTQAKAELLAPVYERLQQVIDAIGVERGYDFIINTDHNACPFINKSKGEDINGVAISRLK
jgi:outer membrane protein